MKRFNIRHVIQKRQKSCSIAVTMVATGFLFILPSKGIAQDNAAPPIAPSPPVESVPVGGVFFADVVVRGQPIFQIGSLSNLSASDRAQIINRRIASAFSTASEWISYSSS